VKTLIVVPTYNEVENLRPLIEEVLSVTPETVSILVVDDASPDGTGKLADELAASDRVSAMHREGKLGLGTAYVAGFKWALERGFDAMIEMDADFSHHPKYLKDMLTTLEDADVAVGSRYVPGGGTVNWGIGRKIISRGGGFYARTILGAPIRDFTGGFNGWHRRVLEAIDLDSVSSSGYSFQIELKYRAWLRDYAIREFPIIFEDRRVGESKMSKAIVFEAMRKVWGFRLNRSRLKG
jgi:dolichol-phosphate mannosyltransferase